MKFVLAILLGGVAAGTLDILAAFAGIVPNGGTEIGVLQFIASGVLGQASFEGGETSAAIGLGVHYALCTIMAAVFVLAARFAPILLKHPWIAGPLYGVAIYFFMNYVAVPLSLVENWTPSQGWARVGGLMAHAFYVGLPIALIAQRFLAPKREAAV